eukprot:scaffold113000_cov57-Phaeocystis_antarctica.AAC.3
MVDQLVEHQLSPLRIEQHEGTRGDARPTLARLVNGRVFAHVDAVVHGVHLFVVETAADALHRPDGLGVSRACRRRVRLVRRAKERERLRVVARLHDGVRTLQQEAHAVRGFAALELAHLGMQHHQLRPHTRERLVRAPLSTCVRTRQVVQVSSANCRGPPARARAQFVTDDEVPHVSCQAAAPPSDGGARGERLFGHEEHRGHKKHVAWSGLGLGLG